jgi:DNA-binding MarR family transcriptional regulator
VTDGAEDTSGSEESLTEAFWALARQLRRQSQQALAPWAITPSHDRALRALAHHDALRLSELSEHLRIAPRSTTEVVDALEEQGLVARRADPHDRRATLVELTARGRQVVDDVRAARASHGERFFDRLAPKQRAELARILRTLREDLPPG